MGDLTAAVIGTLVQERQRFLAFLARRVGDPDTAEDLLQTAVLRALRRADTLRDGERVIAWIYRILRNVLTDYRRHGAAAMRARDAVSTDLPTSVPEPELEAVVCACVNRLLDTLPSDHARILRMVEIEEQTPATAAQVLGLSAGNARVRLHRARAVLRRRVEEMCRTCAAHGCLDCTCRTAGEGPV